MRCTGAKPDGTRCANVATSGRRTCRWHSRRPADIAARLRASSKGGTQKAYGALPAVAALADDPRIAALDLETAGGLRAYLGVTLRALAHLPFDARIANAISALATAQRNMIETSDIAARLDTLEAATTGPHGAG
jgi:hypothetical protein